MDISRKELKPRTLRCNNSWLAKKNIMLSDFVGKSFNKTTILVFVSQQKTTLSAYNQPHTTRNMASHEKAIASGVHQWRSVTSSLAWIARQTRPDLSYRISKIQGTFENACVKDLRECNRIVKCSISTSTRVIYFLHFSWDDAVVVTISDTSSCQIQDQVDGVTKNFKSQQACVTALAPGNALNPEKMLIHPFSWCSTRIRRICRSTLMAEAYALSNAVEHGLRTRAAIVDMRGQLNIRQWEEAASAAMRHPCFTECESIFAHYVSGEVIAIFLSRGVLSIRGIGAPRCSGS